VTVGLPASPPADIAEQARDFVGRGWAGDLIAGWLAGVAPVLLITGEPGAGKTMFAARTVATSRGQAFLGTLTPGFLHAAHFCRHFQTESIDPVSIVEHIGGQLAETVPGYLGILGSISKLNQSSINVGHIDQNIDYVQNSTVIGIQIRIESPDFRLAYLQLIRRPLQRLREEGRTVGDVVVLIDGLDETVEGAMGAPFAMRLAQELRQEVPGLRLCLTSRPGKAADRLNEIADGAGGCARIDLTASQPAGVDDVYTYAGHRLRRLASDQATRSLAGTIAGAAQGNFLYARAAIDDAIQRRSHAPGRLPLPSGLVGVYAAYLDRKLSLDDAAWEQRYRPILGALAQSREEGLSAGHLERITGLTRPVVDDALRRCMPYLHCTPNEETFRPYHESFRDYLRADGSHHVYPADATRAIVTSLCTPWHGRWQDCDDKYILRNLAAHVGDLVQLGDERSVALANEMLESVIADPVFRDAVARMGSEEKLIIDLDRVELEKIGHPIRFSKGQAIFREDESTDFAIQIRAGYVKILTGDRGRLVAIRGPGEVVGELGVVRGGPRAESVVALSDVEARWLPAASWLKFLEEHPRTFLAQLARQERALRDATDKAIDLLPAGQRFARMLADLAKELGEHSESGVVVWLSQRELADLSTASFESVKLIIRQFRSWGIVEIGRGRITVLDLAGLVEIASGARAVRP
jgi:CRP-like cAMP-binding protein